MSSEKPQLLFIQQKTESVIHFIQWVLELVRRRNWFALLVLLGVTLVFIGSFLRSSINKFFFDDAVPAGLWPSFWTAVALIFAAAIIVAAIPKPRLNRDVSDDTPERRAIKGLRPFSQDDTEVFSQLQREVNLKDCYTSITSDSYRFGILIGESGCGKTSFLQAGLWPRLSKSDGSHLGIYVRFSHREPIETIRKALSEQLDKSFSGLKSSPINFNSPVFQNLSFPNEEITDDSFKLSSKDFFLNLLKQAEDAAGKPIVLLFDQFEQFFVHNKRKEDRKPFVEALTAWYQNLDQCSVKILVSIRADLSYEICELHTALKYTLGPQDVFRLEKFTSEEAIAVLGVLADSEQLRFDQRFVTELVEQELTNQETGMVSPVDLQILAWMIDHQSGNELRAFSRKAFYRFGGVEELLKRFLDETLDARVLSNQRQVAIKTLLALTDLDRQVRAGLLTIQDLKAKLKGSAKPEEVSEAVTWLARGDVRLVTPHVLDGIVSYELAHEKLIPALIKQAGKELSDSDKANQLLSRRVNEWLGNHQSRRYLLNWNELRLINRQRPYLIWGTKRHQKEKLIRISRRRSYIIRGTLLAITLIFAFSSSWLFLTPQGQMQQVRWMLNRNSSKYPEEVAMAFIKDGQVSEGMDIVSRHINDSRSKASLIQSTTDLIPRLGNSQKSQQILKQSLEVASTIDSSNAKASALSTISHVYGELNDPTVSEKGLQAVLKSADSLDLTSDKSQVLNSIVAAYSELEDSKVEKEGLKAVLASANTIEDESYQASVLSNIARGTWELNSPTTSERLLQEVLTSANTITDTNSKLSVFISVASAYWNLDNAAMFKKMLREVLQSSQVTNDDSVKHFILNNIANAYGNLDDSEVSQEGLESVLTFANQIDDPSTKSNTLGIIASAYRNLDDLAVSKRGLELVLASANAIDDASAKAYVLSSVARAYWRLGDLEAIQEGLQAILATANTIDDVSAKASVLRDVIPHPWDIDDDTIVPQEILQAVFNSANAIDDASVKATVLSSVAGAYWRLGDVEAIQEGLQAILATANTIDDATDKASVLSSVAGSYWKLDDVEAIQEDLQAILATANTIDDASAKASVLRDVIPRTWDIDGDTIVPQEILQAVFNSAIVIDDVNLKFSVLSDLARTYGQINNVAVSQKGLQSLLNTIETTDELDRSEVESKLSLLGAVTYAYGELNNEAISREGLQSILDIAENLDNSSDKATLLISLGNSYGTLASLPVSQEGLKSILAITEKIDDAYLIPNILTTVVRAISHLAKDDINFSLISQVNDLATSLNANEALAKVSKFKAREKHWRASLETLDGVTEEQKIPALAQILTYRAENRDMRLISDAVVMKAKEADEKSKLGTVLEADIFSIRQDCQNYYIDWWEILSTKGELLYRQLVTNSDVSQQLFTMKSDPLSIPQNQPIIIRAHVARRTGPGALSFMGFYSTQALQGSIATRFRPIRLSTLFASWVEKQEPQPKRCPLE